MRKILCMVIVVGFLMSVGFFAVGNIGETQIGLKTVGETSVVNVTDYGMDNGIIKVDITSDGDLTEFYKNIDGEWENLYIFSSAENLYLYQPYGTEEDYIRIDEYAENREVIENGSTGRGILKYSGNDTIAGQQIYWERYFILEANDKFVTTKLVVKNNGNQTIENLGVYEYMDFDLNGASGDHVFVPLKTGTQQIHVETMFNGTDFADNWIYQRDDNLEDYPYAQAGLLTSAPDTIENFWVAHYGGAYPPDYGIGGDSITTGDIIWGVAWKTNLASNDEKTFYYGIAAPDSMDDLIDISNKFTTEGIYGRLDAPNEASQGDRILVSANITNYFNTTKTIDTTLNLPDGFSSISSLDTSISISSGGSDTATWVVDIGSSTEVLGDNILQLVASTMSEQEEMFHNTTATVHVLPDGVHSWQRVTGLLRDTDFNSTLIVLPSNTIYAEGKVVLYPSVEFVFIDEVKFLIGYPYGCLEQRGSRLLADIEIYYYLFNAGKLTTELQTELQQDIVGGALDIVDLQHDDHGWGWYPTYSSTPFFTSYALLQLVKTKDWASDFSIYIPPSDNGRNMDTYLEYGLEWLIQNQVDGGSWTGVSPDYIEDRAPLTSYNLQVLSLASSAGCSVDGLATSITNATNWLKNAQNTDNGWGKDANEDSDTFTTALAIIALIDAGEAPSASYIQEGRAWLVDHKTASGSNHYWSSALESAYYWFAHEPETTSFAIMALLKTGSTNTDADVSDALDWLLENSDKWIHGGTKDGATTIWMFNELGLIPGTVDSTVTVTVNDAEVGSTYFAGTDLGVKTIDVTQYLNVAGTNVFNISSSGTGDITYEITVDYWTPFTESSRSAGWGDYLTKEIDPGEFGPGEFGANVTLTFTPATEVRYIIINDYIPSGFTLVTDSLPTDIAYEISGERISFLPQVVTTDGVTITYQMIAPDITVTNLNVRPADASSMYEIGKYITSNKPTIDIGGIYSKKFEDPDTGVTVTARYTGTGTINIISVLSPGAPPSGMYGINIFVNITVPDTMNAEWAYVVVPYNEDDLPSDINESTLKLFYWTDNGWEECNNTGVDITNKVVYANVTHFTIFAPMAEKTAGGEGIGGVIKKVADYTWIILLIVAVIIVACIVAVLIKRKKKTPPEYSPVQSQQMQPPAPPQTPTQQPQIQQPVQPQPPAPPQMRPPSPEPTRIPKFCPYCGAETKGSKFCGNCGMKLA